MKKYRKVLKYIWLSLLATVLLLYIFRPNYFTSEFLANALDGNEQLISIVYVAFVLLRSLFFIPSTLPLLIGIALFPGRLDFLLIVNMIGIMGGLSSYTMRQISSPQMTSLVLSKLKDCRKSKRKLIASAFRSSWCGRLFLSFQLILYVMYQAPLK